MSRLVSRTLAYRRQEDRRNRIGARVGLSIFLLMFGVTAGFTSYMFLRYTDQIAAHTHDDWSTIGSLGVCCAFLSFAAFLLVPIVAAGLHETK